MSPLLQPLYHLSTSISLLCLSMECKFNAFNLTSYGIFLLPCILLEAFYSMIFLGGWSVCALIMICIPFIYFSTQSGCGQFHSCSIFCLGSFITFQFYLCLVCASYCVIMFYFLIGYIFFCLFPFILSCYLLCPQEPNFSLSFKSCLS